MSHDCNIYILIATHVSWSSLSLSLSQYQAIFLDIKERSQELFIGMALA